MELLLTMLADMGRHDIRHVLIHFINMGASHAELAFEFERLLEDDAYCASWNQATSFLDS
jgi:hypothetical protein